MDDTVTVRRNITVLTAAQALGGSSAPIVMSLGGLVGQQLADNPAWVTLPVSLFGLGLAIAKQAVDAHGGSIRVQNLPGKGCIFVLELPVEQ